MTDAGVVHRYLIGMIAALVVVILAATLVVRIVGLAGGIIGAVKRSGRAVSRVEGNVSVIPELATSARTADRILAAALGIEAKVRLLADSLEAREVPAVPGGH